jgi:hypothetical protein
MRFSINPFTELLDIVSMTGSGAPPIETISGNSGGAVGPNPITFNLDLLGDNTTGINVVGNAGTFTLTIEGIPSSSTQVGTTRYATNPEAAAQTLTTVALTPSNITSLFSVHPLPASQGGTGLSSPAAHQLMVTEGSSAFTLLGVAGNGQIPIGSIGSDPVLNTITAGAGISIVDGPGTITISTAGSGTLNTITGDVGGPLSPTLGNINIFSAVTAAGSIPIRTSGAASTLTIDIQKSQAIAASDATKVGLAAFNSADFTVDANGFVSSSGTGLMNTLTGNSGGAIAPVAGNINTVGTGSITIAGAGNTLTTQLTGLTNHSLLVGAGTATITNLGVATNGQLPIGSTGADPVLAVLTPGTGISITNGAGSITIASAASVATTYTEDSGTAIPALNNLNVLGTAAQGISTSGAGSTITITAANATAVQKGVASFNSTEFTVTAGAVASNAITVTSGANITATASWNLGGAASIAVSGTTNHSLQLGNVGGSLTSLGVATNGQLPIGSTGADPVLAALTAGTGISITNGAGSITIATNGSSTINTLTGNTGGAISPSAGNINTLGTGSITIAGSGSTLTTQLTGLTNHAVLVGAGTATITNVGPTATAGQILQSAGSLADPAFSTATYPASTTINQILYSSAANVVSGLATNNRSVLTTTTAQAPVWIVINDGQLIIGSSAGNPAAANLTAGTGIAITNASNSITISSVSAGFAWSDTSGAFAAVAQNGYFITATSTATLPASPSEGDTIIFVVDTTQILTIQANTGQLIRIGSTISAAAGTATSNARGDSIVIVYRSTGTTWFARGAPEGIWTVT